jgi:hypothetical protein
MDKQAVKTGKSQPKRDNEEQSRTFIEKAREVGADEEKSAADELLGQLARKPPEPHSKQRSRKE